MRVAMLAAALALGTAPALAQTGMISVSIPSTEVLGDFISEEDAAALELPMAIELPVGIAANACGVDADDLAKRLKDGAASCTAQTGSRALAEAVKKHGGEKK